MSRQKARNAKNIKRIIFMAPTPPPYMGPSVATEIILNSRFVEEFNVIHIDTADRRPLNNLGRVDLINIFLSLKHYLQLVKNLLASKADLVYLLISQTTIGFLRDIPFIIITKIFRKKIVIHLRGGYLRKYYDNTNIMMQFFIRNALKKIDQMIVLCDSVKKYFENFIPRKKISVVPNGLNMTIAKNRARSDNELTILFLSNLRESKGLWEVLFSIYKVVKYCRNIKFVFAGAWRYDKDRIKCEHYLKNEKLDVYVEFKGFILGNDKMELLEEADIFVLPSFSEGHPWVIIEAMAAGLPIIATDTGCICESIIDGENGFIIPKKDSEALAEKIIYFIKYPLEREKMGRRSRDLYEQNFTEDHFVQRMMDSINNTFS